MIRRPEFPPAGVVCRGSAVLLRLYRWLGSEAARSRLRRLVLRLESGAANSLTIREFFRRFHGVEVGLFTAGPCLNRPKVYHPGTRFGRYSYIADTVRTFTRNHPMNIRSTHGLFYNPALGRVKGEPLQFGRLSIGHGVWIGHNATLLPPCREIGHGAVIAPGSVVSADVPPYALVSGFPARVTGYRFAKERIEELLTSRWWEKAPGELETGGGGMSGSEG